MEMSPEERTSFHRINNSALNKVDVIRGIVVVLAYAASGD